jgi:hypothetical protein
MKDCLLLVFANKQDLPGGKPSPPSRLVRILAAWLIRLNPIAMSPAEVTEKLGLHRMRDRLWYVHPRSVLSILFLAFTMLTLSTVVPPPERGSLRASSGCPTPFVGSHRSKRSYSAHCHTPGSVSSTRIALMSIPAMTPLSSAPFYS